MRHTLREETQYPKRSAAGSGTIPGRAKGRARDWTQQWGRPAGTVVAIALALLLGWHVVQGKHGLQVWEQQRAEDRQLQKEIDDLQQENAHLRDHVKRLESDPNAIKTEAHKQLHYVGPDDIVYMDSTPAQHPAQPPAQPSGPAR